jgi:hypothetical protein
MATPTKRSMPTVDILRVGEVTAIAGSVELELLVAWHDNGERQTEIRLCVDAEQAKDLHGKLHGALIVVRTRNRGSS